MGLLYVLALGKDECSRQALSVYCQNFRLPIYLPTDAPRAFLNNYHYRLDNVWLTNPALQLGLHCCPLFRCLHYERTQEDRILEFLARGWSSNSVLDKRSFLQKSGKTDTLPHILNTNSLTHLYLNYIPITLTPTSNEDFPTLFFPQFVLTTLRYNGYPGKDFGIWTKLAHKS